MPSILIVLLAIANLLFHSPAQADSLPQASFDSLIETQSAKVEQIISPTTIELENGQIIRLSGLHLPDYNEDQAGAISLLTIKILQDFLIGHTVTLYQTRTKDLGRNTRMGHILAHVVRNTDRAWVQGTMLQLGLALVQTTQSNPEMAQEMLALENKARNEKIGIWRESTKILNPEDASLHIGRFQIVEGTVESAALKKNRLYLNFGKNWRNDFTVTVAPENKRAFTKKEINLLDWNGKTLRVRGWITAHNGPNIDIDHPEAIELIEVMTKQTP